MSFSQWHLAPGSEGILITDIDMYEKYPDTMYAIGLGTDSLNGLLSTDGGVTWGKFKIPASMPGAIKIDISDSKTQYASFNGPSLGGNTVARTNDGWNTFKVLFIGINYPVPVIERDPHNKQTYYVGVGPSYLYRSSDNFQTSELVFQESPVNSISFDPFDDSTLYLGTGSGLWKSTDNGVSWTKLWLGFDARLITSIIIHPLNNDILLASVYGHDTTSMIGGVFKSTDQGSTWYGINNGLTPSDRDIGRMAMNPKNPNELFIETSKYGVNSRILFRTSNGGDSWEDYSDGLPSRASSIFIDTVHNRIIAGTGSGLFTIDLTNGISDNNSSMVNNFKLSQNYPNPFNPTTQIKFDLKDNGIVKLTVYGILGREVKMLVNEYRPAGSYDVMFNANNLSSGVYFYKLQSGNFVMTKKMLLAR